MNRYEFLEIIEKSEQSFVHEFSHKNGSDYYTVNGVSLRVSDHRKPKCSFCADSYNENNDFNNYNDAHNYLCSLLDMSDKSEIKKAFYLENEKNLIVGYSEKFGTTYTTSFGNTFCDKNQALNYIWLNR